MGTEEEWLKGKTIQISGLQPSSGYLVRLIAENDAGTTHGEIVEIFTKAPKDSGAFSKTPTLRERRGSSGGEAGEANIEEDGGLAFGKSRSMVPSLSLG